MVVSEPATGTVRLGETELVLNRPIDAAKGAVVALAMRPESANLGSGEAGDLTLTGRITEVQFLRAIIRITADVGGQDLTLDTFNRPEAPHPAIGSDLPISLPSARLVLLVG